MVEPNLMKYARVFARRRRHHRNRKNQYFNRWFKTDEEIHYSMMESHEMAEEVITILWNELKRELLKEKE